MEHLEIERKYLIAMPDMAFLARLSVSEIEQVYLLSPQGGRERVRRRDYGDRVEYTHTVKRRISDLSRVESEREISAGEYDALLSFADPELRTIRKKRYLCPYLGECFEIDVFPFWDDHAVLELELQREDQTIAFPPEIRILRELTHDKRYTNSAMAREIPDPAADAEQE